MRLKEYQRKRDFTKSPEPSGDDADARRRRQGQPRFFCVQKHLASHLHYDLRLEHDGVLMSWAVPKGPSLDPSIKRLAMQVEDHPVEYGTFEGLIPSGYGAGVVMLWDEGTWTPQTPDVDAALAKGDLKFELDGYKLKGSWVLVRTRGYGGQRADGRSWLLIKHRDDWSGDLDITTFAPRSVKSEEDFAGILASEDVDVWKTDRPAGGETGALLKQVIEEAAALKAARAKPPARTAAAPRKSTGKRAGAKTSGKTPAARKGRTRKTS